jgi:hypothetical protein
VTDFLVRRDDLRVWRAVDSASEAPLPGELQLRVERFGLTANNVTYGLLGEQFGYWSFYPAPDGWGRIPAWGFGEVIASGVDGIAAGERFYGYWPMSNAVTVRARATPEGFAESSDARAALPPIYNQYVRATPERGFLPEHDDASAVLRPLHRTGWLIADSLEQSGWRDATAIVLASASSKTAFATAYELATRSERPELIGLTSHRAFTESLGCYERVLGYDEIAALPADIVLVDMAGAAQVRRAVHEHAADALRASIMVGATHWKEAVFGPGDPLPGPEPELFFAPAHSGQRIAQLGLGEFLRQVSASWTAFADRAPELFEIERHTGAEALGRVYDSFIDGSVDPRTAYVFSL